MSTGVHYQDVYGLPTGSDSLVCHGSLGLCMHGYASVCMVMHLYTQVISVCTCMHGYASVYTSYFCMHVYTCVYMSKKNRKQLGTRKLGTRNDPSTGSELSTASVTRSTTSVARSTISLTPATKARLDDRKLHPRATYEEVIIRLLDVTEPTDRSS